MSDLSGKRSLTPATDREPVESDLLATAALVAEHLAQRPILNEDPIARRLGLVPDRERMLDPAALKRYRKRANLGVEALADRLKLRGWRTRPVEVLAWEAGNTTSVPPAIVAAIAEELGLSPTDLIRQVPNPAPNRLERLGRDQLAALVERIAKSKAISSIAALDLLERSQASFVFRGEPNDEQFLLILERFVQALERDV